MIRVALGLPISYFLRDSFAASMPVLKAPWEKEY
jgi:hypothetical protein